MAALHSLTLDELLALNGLTTDAVLQVGDQLLIREMPTPTPEPVTATPTPEAEPPTPTETAPASKTVAASSLLALAGGPVLPTPTPEPSPTPAEEAGGADSIFTGSVIFALLVLGGAAWLFSRGRI